MPGLSVDVVSGPATLFCRLNRIWSVGEFAKTARAPPVAMLKFACGAAALRIWSRIFCEIAVMLCVVNRLAAAMSSLWTPATNAEPSASISALRYAFVAGSFVWPKLRSWRKVVVSSGLPSASWTPRVTTSRYVESWSSCSALSACKVLVSGSQTAWSMPTMWPPGPIRKMFELETVERSIGPENGIVRRGWMLNPSSVSRTETSSQRSGIGRAVR